MHIKPTCVVFSLNTDNRKHHVRHWAAALSRVFHVGYWTHCHDGPVALVKLDTSPSFINYLFFIKWWMPNIVLREVVVRLIALNVDT